jgi:hypothetical protein
LWGRHYLINLLHLKQIIDIKVFNVFSLLNDYSNLKIINKYFL